MKKNWALFFFTLKSLLKKEFIYISRDPTVITMAIVFPIIELLLLGYLLDINVRNVRVAVHDLSKTQQSRQLLSQLTNTNIFKIVEYVDSSKKLNQAIVAGRASVGIEIPVDYAQKRVDGQPADILALIDGSNSTITSESINALSGVTLKETLGRALAQRGRGRDALPIEVHSAVLFNPNTRSANFFLPGLIVWELPMITVILVTLTFVREKEKGTFEQLAITPMNPLGYVLGKSLPYMLLALLLLCEILVVTRYVFQVPIAGSVATLLLLSLPFIITSIGMSIVISSFASTQIDASQISTIFRVLPPFYFSGYFFPLDSSPKFFEIFTRIVPERYFMEICRGVILRGADFDNLWSHGLILSIMGLIMISLAAFIYKRKIV